MGVGRMGRGIARRYLDAGFSVKVWNRTRSKADDLVARGAEWAGSPVRAAEEAGGVGTMVADDEASRAVWLGEQGVLADWKPDRVAIECSTVSYAHACDL